MEKKKGTWKNWVSTVFLILFISILATRFLGLYTSNYVSGTSMYPTLKSGDIVLGSGLSLSLDNLKRGDIVIVDKTDEDFEIIKRIVGLPGEHIVIKDNVITIDGEVLEEDYLSQEFTGTGFYIDTTLDENEYFICGDNRYNSFDSRYYGAISKDEIKSVVKKVIKLGSWFEN